MLFARRRNAAVPAAAPQGPDRACDGLGALAEPFSPLIAELMAVHCHTRPIGAIARTEQCADEYQLVARSIIQHLLEGWQIQTGGAGTIDDLLLQPRLRITPQRSGPAEDTQEHLRVVEVDGHIRRTGFTQVRGA
ncbi:hypothetical protein ACF1FX_33680 [Streptomyces sp. NPDC014646]|uniref:hypothetical protein n=1 Tax=Streptomyces sp. NPDC014646 TaxID=3364877 RepID=UPI003701C82A